MVAVSRKGKKPQKVQNSSGGEAKTKSTPKADSSPAQKENPEGSRFNVLAADKEDAGETVVTEMEMEKKDNNEAITSRKPQVESSVNPNAGIIGQENKEKPLVNQKDKTPVVESQKIDPADPKKSSSKGMNARVRKAEEKKEQKKDKGKNLLRRNWAQIQV